MNPNIRNLSVTVLVLGKTFTSEIWNVQYLYICMNSIYIYINMQMTEKIDASIRLK